MLEEEQKMACLFINNVQFDHLCLTGDLNTNFLRQNSGHVRSVQNFINELNLEKSWDKYEIDFTHSHELENVSHVSIIDHFLWNQGLIKYIEDCGVLHLLENNSDHEPIYCVIDVPMIEPVKED